MRKARKHREKKSKTKQPVRYVSKALIPSYFEQVAKPYRLNLVKKYRRQDSGLSEKVNLYGALLSVASMLLAVVYLDLLSFPTEKGRIEQQVYLVGLLQSLKLHSIESVEAVLVETAALDLFEGQFFRFRNQLRYLLQFLKAESLYAETGEVPKDVFDTLYVDREHLSPEETAVYMSYLSEMTERCMNDLLPQALDNFERIFPSVSLVGIEDTRPARPKAVKPAMVRKTIHFRLAAEVVGTTEDKDSEAANENQSPSS